MGKIVSHEEFKEIKKQLREEGKKIGLSHGVFDLVHPGHMVHFQEAKKMVDVLVVSITSEKYVRKGPDRPYFNDTLRLNFLAGIECIDYVLLSENYTSDDVVKVVEPDLYIKGKEYQRAEDDITGKITEETELVQKYGGTVAFTEGQVYSSTNLINNALPSLSEEVKEYMKGFCKSYQLKDFQNLLEEIRKLKVLVVGDAIIDKYTYCNVQGLMSKDMGYSARYKQEEMHLGGSLAVARHMSSFTDNVTLASVIGNETEVHSRILNELGGRMYLDLEYSKEWATIVKQRFITLNEKRGELHKVFSINNLPEPVIINRISMEHFMKKIREKISDYDVVVICDFGHGLITGSVQELLQDKAKFLAVNCQTNSSNFGMNIITKYTRADVFALDQKELKLAYPSYNISEADALRKLCTHLNGKGWLTRGALGAYGMEEGKMHDCPAFVLKVKDTIGAGDAFYAVATLFAAAGGTLEQTVFVGNIAGALAANIVGNREPIEKVNFLKYASTLLNI